MNFMDKRYSIGMDFGTLSARAVFGLELDRKYYLTKELNKKIRKISTE
jgi:ribulose kinase